MSHPLLPAEKNRLCPPNPWPQTPFDFLRAILLGIRSEASWQEADLATWLRDSRLNLLGALPAHPDQEQVRALQTRFFAALFPALENIERLAGQVTDAERARIYEPA